MGSSDGLLTVLLVEDLEDDRYFFQHTLKKARPSVNLVTAHDGAEALDYFQNQGRFANAHSFPRPDLVFLDLKMPGPNGFDILRWMNGCSLMQTVKVIVLSGSSEPRDMALARELGASAYLIKPVTIDRLQELLDTATP